MTSSPQFFHLETSLIHHQFPAVNKYGGTLEEVFFKSPEKQLKIIQGVWSIELSMRADTSKGYGYGYSVIKGYLHLKLCNEAFLKSGLYPHIDFIINDERLCTNGSFVNVNQAIQQTKSVFSGARPTPIKFNTSLNVIVILTLKSKRMIKNSTILHDEFDKHWHKTASFYEMQDQDDYKDFTFIIGNQEFKIHKCIFSGKSDVLKTMFMSGFDESKNNSTKVTDIDPEVFQVFLDFMYGNKDQFYEKIMNFVYSVYAAAHKYEIDVLKDFCVQYISENFTGPDRAIESFAFASFYGLEELQEKCWEIIKIGIFKDQTLENPQDEEVAKLFQEIKHHQEGLEGTKCEIVKKLLKRSSMK